MSDVFYVYEHWRPDTGKCFYVGKGRDRRAWDMKNMRNRHHMAVTSKLTSIGLCVDVRLIASNISEDAALSLEIDLIASHGMDNLTNMTSGGDGLKSPCEETRLKMSISQKKRFRENPDQIAKMSQSRKGRTTSKETKAKLSAAGAGRTHSVDARNKISIARKAAGIPEHVREAQRKALTGKKRAPFSAETILKMKIAAQRREETKRPKRLEA